MVRKQIEIAEETLIRFDDRAREVFEPYAGSPPIQALDLFS
jgi:hypothetical protein